MTEQNIDLKKLDKKICGYCKHSDTMFPRNQPIYLACTLKDKEVDYHDKSCNDYELNKFGLIMSRAWRIIDEGEYDFD